MYTCVTSTFVHLCTHRQARIFFPSPGVQTGTCSAAFYHIFFSVLSLPLQTAFFIYFLFHFRLPGHLLATQRHLKAPAVPSPQVPCSADLGPPFAPKVGCSYGESVLDTLPGFCRGRGQNGNAPVSFPLPFEALMFMNFHPELSWKMRRSFLFFFLFLSHF